MSTPTAVAGTGSQPVVPETLPVAAASRRRRGVLGIRVAAAVLGLVVLMVVAAPLLAPYDPNAQDLLLGATAPGTDGHLLGTDQLGRDLLSRLLFGGRPVLAVSVVAALLAGAVGILLGVSSGYLGGLVDDALSRLTEIQLAIPTILLAIVVIGFGATGLPVLVAILVLAEWPLFFRLSRSVVAALRQQPYLAAAVGYGASRARIVVLHLGRAVLPVAVVAFTLTFANAIALESSLSYLGLGVQPPQSDWGSMVAQGKAQLSDAWWISILPGLAIAAVVFATNRLGDRLADRASLGDHGGELGG